MSTADTTKPALKLFNTMSREVELFVPQSKGKVSLYTCGPTVYDYQQIGNYATYIRWDVLARLLAYLGYDLTWVMNITDVGHLVSDADEGEDKLEKGARREGKSAWDVAEFYLADFLASMEALNISEPTYLVRATDHIKEQIALVKRLEEKGFTYVIDDGVYFDTSKSKDYGRLARLDLKKLQAGARVELNPQKRHHTDFALWKFSPKDAQRDMEWESPWGTGFPGWHIECSAMSMQYLGETLDIHAGGIDHLPVHHTNEIAQSEGATGKQFVNYWLHGNFITVDGTKLSKSLGNSYTLHDVKERGFEPLDFRMFVLQAHYRTQADFTWKSLKAARARRLRLQAIADLRFQLNDEEHDLQADFDRYQRAIVEALSLDLNSPRALSALSALEAQLEAGQRPSNEELVSFLEVIDTLLGLRLLESENITDEQERLIQEREEARKRGDFKRADEIRVELGDARIVLQDTASGPIWSRT